MRRIVPFLLAAVAVGCDPTGHGMPSTDNANVRLANFLVDAGGMSLATQGGTFINGVTFGTTSPYALLPDGQAIFSASQTSNGFLTTTDTVQVVKDRHYTFYLLGKLTSAAGRFPVDDSVLAAAGTYKVRFVHGVGTYSAFGLDFFADTDSSLVGLTPTYSGLSYGTVGVYVPVDTGIRRLRIVKATTTTPVLLDTTFATPIPSGSVLTMVATNLQGGATPFLLTIVPDTIP